MSHSVAGRRPGAGNPRIPTLKPNPPQPTRPSGPGGASQQIARESTRSAPATLSGRGAAADMTEHKKGPPE